ncbi:unnamed protein product [Rhodiola kirilowii]
MASERESEDSAAKTSLAGTTNAATSIYQPRLNLSIDADVDANLTNLVY